MFFDRNVLTLHNITQNLFSSRQNWLEFLLASSLFIISLIGVRFLVTQKWANLTNRDNLFWPHLIKRLIWPLFLLALTAIAHYFWQFFGLQPLWLSFLGIITLWLIIIRTTMAITRFALPNSLFEKNGEYFFSVILWLGFVFWLSGLDDIILHSLNYVTFTIGNTKISLLKILSALLWIGVTLIISLWLGRLLEVRIMSLKSIDLNVRIVINKISRISLVFLAMIITLPMVGVDLTILSVFGGAVGVGIGFGLQKIASNYISGFIILLDRSIRMGDRLILNDKTTGYVTKITSRYVVLKGLDGSEALVPNESMISNTVINQSYSDKNMWQQIKVQVAYNTDLTQALAILQAAATHPRVLTNPGPNAYVIDFGDSGIDLSIGFWVRDPENGFLGLRSSILLSIWSQFKQHKIEFPFPQREIRVLNNSAADIPAESVAKKMDETKVTEDTQS